MVLLAIDLRVDQRQVQHTLPHFAETATDQAVLPIRMHVAVFVHVRARVFLC